MTTETKTNSRARKIKAVSALLMIVGMVGVMFAANLEGPVGPFIIAGLLGFFGFVVGRFME